jgi:hypothetical protein
MWRASPVGADVALCVQLHVLNKYFIYPVAFLKSLFSVTEMQSATCLVLSKTVGRLGTRYGESCPSHHCQKHGGKVVHPTHRYEINTAVAVGWKGECYLVGGLT